MKKLFLLFLLMILAIGCGEREDTVVKSGTISPEFIGTWYVTKAMNANGVMVANTDTSLFVTVTNSNITYKLPKQSGSGFGTIENVNADVITFNDGTKVYLWKTEYPDNEKNFSVRYPNGKEDDVMVKKN